MSSPNKDPINSQDITNTTQTAMPPPDLRGHYHKPSPSYHHPSHTQQPTPYHHPTQSSTTISTALDLNAALRKLSLHMHHVRRAIEPLRDAISAANDPLGINIDVREKEEEARKRGEEAEDEELDVEVKEKIEKGVTHAPDIGSEMAGDFTGMWETSEEWGFGRLENVKHQ